MIRVAWFVIRGVCISRIVHHKTLLILLLFQTKAKFLTMEFICFLWVKVLNMQKQYL